MAKSKINGGFIVLPKRTLKCAAWKKLKASDKVIFLTMLTEFFRDKKANPDNIVKITHRQIAERSGLGLATVVRGMSRLKESDFLKVEKRGGFSGNPSTYRLTGKYLF